MKKSLMEMLVIMLAIIVCMTVLSCGKKKEAVLRIGTNAEYPPFEFKNGGEFAGVDMDMAKKLAEKMGMKYQIIDMDFDALIPSLTSNKIDIAVSAITITPERQNQVDFSVPYYEANQVIIAKPDNKIKITKVEDLVNYKVGAQNGTTGQIYITKNLVEKKLMKKENLRKYSTNIEGITDMLNGNIDFVIIDDSAAKGYSKLKPLATIYKIDTKENYGIALQKNSIYKEKINATITDMLNNGEMLQIIQTNFK